MSLSVENVQFVYLRVHKISKIGTRVENDRSSNFCTSIKVEIQEKTDILSTLNKLTRMNAANVHHQLAVDEDPHVVITSERKALVL